MKLLWSFVLGTIFAFTLTQACSVTNLGLVQDGTHLQVSWNSEANPEDCVFQVTFLSDAEAHESEIVEVSGKTTHIFDHVIPCSTVSVTVAGLSGTATGSLVIDTSASEAPVLIEMITSCNSIQMLWEAQSYQENMCEVTHFQMFCLSDTHNFTIPQAVTDVTHRNFDILITVLRPDIYYTCNGFIFVTLGGFSPASDDIAFWSNLDTVRDLQVTETDNALSASWEAPLNSEECGVAYDVTYENEVLGTTTIEVVGLSHTFDIPLISCSDYTITVTPIAFTGTKGTGVSQSITPSLRVGGITGLSAIDDTTNDAIVLSWDEADAGLCEVHYVVQHLLNGESYTIEQIDGTSHEFERIPCSSSTFSVQAISNDVAGDIAVGDIGTVDLDLDVSDITWIGAVANVRLEGGLIAWEAPTSIGLCSISYRVQIQNDFWGSDNLIPDTSAEFQTIPCSNNEVIITGVSGSVTGESVIYTITAPSAEFSAPLHVRTNPGFTSAQITLQADSFSDNMCDIGTVEVQCANRNGPSYEGSIPVTDDATRVFTVDLDGLEMDTIYDCVAAWQNSASGNEFSFRTIPLVANVLSVSDVGQNGFLVSWNEEYGREFVNDYSLVIESTGPRHAVRDDCDIERGATYTFTLDSSALSSAFVQGFPNYAYRISLTTSYTLGVSVASSDLNANTNTGVPGIPENLGYAIVQDNSGYNARAILQWITPCDLNGDLRNFQAEIVARFVFGGAEQIVSKSVEISGDGDTVNDVFGYSLNDLNPFFTYEVSLRTIAAAQSGSADLTIVPPEACSCP
jgi:CheY-specific phosphatase CheX